MQRQKLSCEIHTHTPAQEDSADFMLDAFVV